jgi:muramoyltetrapeptide carboxypeptidase
MSINLKLTSNDQIALTCPGSICRQADHPQITQEYLKKHYQLNAIFADDTTQRMHPEKRAEIFLDYVFNDNIKLITTLRGGEGSADIIPYLHRHHEKIKLVSPKFLLGLSDFTSLLIYFSQHYHWPTIHGPSPVQFAFERVDEPTQQLTMDLLFGNDQGSGLHHLTPLNDAAREEKIIEAELTGGNLSIIDISIKDVWEIDMTNKIIFLEDVSEKAHKIIRTLKYFSRIGLFAHIKAVILGDFTCDAIGCSDEEQETNKQAILKTLSSFAAHHHFPVLYSEQFGHGKTNLPLVYSTNYRLQLGNQPQLTLLK